MSDNYRKKTLPISDAAHFLGISPETLRRWDQKGILKPFRTKGGQRRYSLATLEAVKSGERKPPKLSISQAARELGVHPETLRRWERSGDLSAERTNGGQRRYSSSEIAKLEAPPPPPSPFKVSPAPASEAPAQSQVAVPSTGPGGLPPLSSLPPRMPLTPPPLKEKPKAEPIPIPIRRPEHYRPEIAEKIETAKKVSVVALSLLVALTFWLDAFSPLTRERVKRLVAPSISSPIVDINDIAGYEIVGDKVSFIRFKFPLDVPGLVTQTLTVLGDAVFNSARFLGTAFFGEGNQYFISPTGDASFRNISSEGGTFQEVNVTNLNVQNLTVEGSTIGGGGDGAGGGSGPAQGGDADTLEGQPGSYYLDLNNEVGTCNNCLTSVEIDESTLIITNAENANTLDGLDSTQFLRSDTSDSFTSGTLTFDSGTTLLLSAGSIFNVQSSIVNSIGTLLLDDAVQITGDLTIDGLTVTNGNVILGDTAADTITFIGVVDSDILPSASNTWDLGSTALRWGTGYFDNVDANTISGTLASSGTISNSWTINQDNLTANAETSALAFETGTFPFNAVVQWNAAGDPGKFTGYDDNFVFNYPISLFSQVSGGNQTFTSGSLINYGQSATHAITQTGALTGMDLDFSSNITVPDSLAGNQIGVLVTLLDGGASATSIGLQTGGTLDFGLDIGGTVLGADIRLSNGETIDNLIDGLVSIGGNLYATGTIESAATVQGTQLISTSATGTAPLIVSSTTLVTNLNADLLDDQTGSYYLDLDNQTGTCANCLTTVEINESTLTGLNSTNINDIYLFNTGDTATGDYNFDAGTLFVDSVNNAVGIGTTGPFSFTLQVSGSIGPDSSPTITSQAQTSTTIDSANSVGQYSSIAIGTDGLPIISHYDSTTFDLRVSKCTNTSCTSAISTTIDSANNVGLFTSIAIGTDGLPIISYYDSTNGDLRVSKCTNTSCTSATSTTIDSANSVGLYTSIAIGTDGLPIISYYDSTNADLRVSKCTNTSCTSATSTTIDSANSVGLYTSIAIGTDGLPIISHFNNTTFDLRVSKCTNTSCTSATSTTIDSTNNVGQYSSIAIGTDGLPVISHQDNTNGDLRVSKCTNTSCTSATSTTIDSANSVGLYTSIAIGTDGLPIISYYDSTNADLRVSKLGSPSGSYTPGSYWSGGSDLGNREKFFNNVYATQYWGRQFQIADFADIAENYSAEDGSIESGDLVRPKQGTVVEKTKKTYDQAILGIVSTNPGIILSKESGNQPIALSGRVPLKVSSINGPIEVGDPITSSEIPGVGMKATKAGPIAGKALEPYDNPNPNAVEKIMVFINLSWVDPQFLIDQDGDAAEEVSTQDEESGKENQDGEIGEEDPNPEEKPETEKISIPPLEAEEGFFQRITVAVEAVFEKLVAQTAEFVSAFVENLTVDQLFVSDKTSGQGLVREGTDEDLIESNLVKENSKVFVTFRDPYNPATQYWVEEIKEGESFIVKLDEPVGQDARFDYWIVN